MKNNDKETGRNPIIANADGATETNDNYGWISSTGTSLATIFDVIFNGKSPTQDTTNSTITTEKSNSYIWWIVAGLVIVVGIVFLSFYLKKK